MTSFYQIYFEEHQKQHLYPFATPYYNERLTVFFENAVIAKLVRECTTDKIGVCSWALKEKLRFFIPPRRELTAEVLESDYDVLLLTKNTKDHRMLTRAEQWHPGFIEMMTKILDKIGYRCPTEVKHPVYFNHFVARTEIYKEYCAKMLVPAMLMMELDDELNAIAWKDSGYFKLKGSKLPEKAQKDLGVDYWPMATFLLERFFSIYINDKNLNIQYL